MTTSHLKVMYLEHFKFKEQPFSLTPNTDFFCRLSGHEATLDIVLISLRNGEGFIKVIGEVGTGKTLLCRLLLDQLNEEFITAYIPNPVLTPQGLRMALAQELELPPPYPQHSIIDLITKKLIQYHEMGKRVVLLIDEAQAMPAETLETLRLLTNLETNTTKLLQVVLLGQPELDVRLSQPNLRQLKQRIVFSHYLPPLSRKELDDYLSHRLAMAGYTWGPLFTRQACNLLFQKTRGIPRLVNVLCHKALMIAYGRGDNKVHYQAVRLAVKDTESISDPKKDKLKKLACLSLGFLVGILGIMQYHDVWKDFW